MHTNKKDEEVTASNPYARLEKSAVIQEARAFNETPINVKKCSQTLCKLLYLFQHGETINRTEATGIFFAMTKLWNCKNPVVRRLVYIAIKELVDAADDVIIVTSSLMKDMTGREDVFRPAAIRSLCQIIDGGMLQTIERYLKQAIVDKVPAVASAALVSCLHLFRKNPEFIRRFANEVQEAVSSTNHMVQFHALSLLYHIRSTDRLAVIKLVQKFSKLRLLSPLATCYLIRIAAKLVEEEDEGGDRTPFQFIESCLRHKKDMVSYEAASAMVRFPNITRGELDAAISSLQNFCSSPKPSLRFAAVKTLNQVSNNYPQAVGSCNVDLELLIADQNRSIATLAITTLLKTGAETSVERLMKQIGSFVSEISDEFKIVVIEAVQSLCLRYPRKHTTMMNFLAKMLREEGSYEYKKSIVDTIISIIEDNQEAKELGLSHLCEFIEDCEHPKLATRILYLLGSEGPNVVSPQHYIRFIYNRLILEAVQVRGAAITALAKFGAQCPKLRQSVVTLLKRSLYDTDDEVRDRATFYLAVLRNGQQNIVADFILNLLQISVIGLERQTEQYLTDGNFTNPFDIKKVPISSQPITACETKKPTLSSEAPSKKVEKTKASSQDAYAQQLSSIPSISKLGAIFKSSLPIQLTDSFAEYTVSVVKHVFQDHVVLQFDCKNTLNDQLLTDVHIELKPSDESEWEIMETIPLAALPYSEVGTSYTILKDESLAETFGATLKFKLLDVDPATGEPESGEFYDDSYVLEEVEVQLGDHIQGVMKANFSSSWDIAGEENEVEETYSLSSYDGIQDAVDGLLKFLSMAPCEHSEKVAAGKSSHTLLISGKYRTGQDVLAKIRLALDPSDNSVTMNIVVRGEEKEISEVIASAIS